MKTAKFNQTGQVYRHVANSEKAICPKLSILTNVKIDRGGGGAEFII
jgi:hypothetical protein